MKLSNSLLFLLSIVSAAHAIAVPDSHSDEVTDLFKRKGGGGGGGRGSSSGSSGGSSSGSKSGSSGSSSTSTTGGKTPSGSGPTPRFGGGKFYAGGAKVPYKSGSRSPSGLLPLALIGGGLLFWSAAWAAGSHMYSFPDKYTFRNETATPPKNETLPVFCICQPNVVCGCDDTDDYAWLDDIIGNGSYSALNDTLVFVGKVNGTKGIYINGTLPPGTTAASGTDSSAYHLAGMINAVGFWPVALAVGAITFL